jgi:4-amino-4-deoxy-L-arabinose transferase-like glycosyltransferase
LLVAAHARVYLRAVWEQSVQVEGTRYFTLADDGMISMRYARNLAQGHGLVWNAGERVEGVTNLGWTLLMAVVHLFRRPPNENGLYVQLVNLVIAVAVVLYVFSAVRRRSGSFAALAAAALLAADGPLLCWGSWGFETSLQALLFAVGLVPLLVAVDERQQAEGFPRAMACLGTAFVVRPDTLALVGLMIGVACWWRWRRAIDDRGLAAGLLLAGVPIAGVLLFQRLYYDAWLPNTFHLKATGGAAQFHRGIAYLLDFCGGPFFQLPLLAGSLMLTVRDLTSRQARHTAIAPAACLAGWVGYVVVIGGDAFPCSRFFVPVVPLLTTATALFLWRELATWRGESSRRGSLAWKAAAVVLAGLLVPYARQFEPGVRSLGGRNADNVEGIQAAVALEEACLPTHALTAVYFAGVLPYLLPEHRFHDLLGKSDLHIARTLAHAGPPGHNKWDYTYSLGRVRPDLVVTAAPYKGATDAEMERQFEAGADYGSHPALWIHPLFRQRYRANRVRLSVDGAPVAQVMWVYARRDSPTDALPLVVPPFDPEAEEGGRALATLHRRLEPDVRLGLRFGRPSWGLDRTPDGQRFAWLGPTGTEGLTVNVKSAATSLHASLSFEVCPGPGRADAKRTLQVTRTIADVSSLVFAGSFTRCEQFATSVPLDPGKNRFRWTIADSSDGSATWPFMAMVSRIRFGPTTTPGSHRLESLLRVIAGW